MSKALADFFATYKESSVYWYKLKGDANEPNTLATLLGLPPELFDQMLLVVGLSKKHGKQRHIQLDKWESLLMGMASDPF